MSLKKVIKTALSYSLFLALILLVVPALSYSQSVGHSLLTVPKGRRVMMDGRVEPDEWKDAREVRVSPSVLVYLKQDGEYLYVAVKPAKPRVFGVNLYFDNGDRRGQLNLHASAKLGERYGRSANWPEWEWWNNRGWIANVERFDSFEQRRFLPDEAKEFQISLGRIRGTLLSMRLDIESDQGTEEMPEAGAIRDNRHWLDLRF